MKLILALTLLASFGCASKPLLQPGSCYSVYLRSTIDKSDPHSAGGIHELAEFKIVNIIDWNGEKTYLVQMIKDDWSKGYYRIVPKYSKTKTFGWAPVKVFDKHVGVLAGKWWSPNKNEVECNPITEEDRAKGAKGTIESLN